MNARILAAMAFASIVSLTVATAGGNCGTGSTAKKAGSGSCCSTTSKAAVKKVSDEGATCSTTAKKDAKECSTEDEGASCSTSKTAKAKKASMTSAGSCCSMKAKDVKSTSVIPATEAASATPAAPQK